MELLFWSTILFGSLFFSPLPLRFERPPAENGKSVITTKYAKNARIHTDLVGHFSFEHERLGLGECRNESPFL
jgi:hypothetical protein